MNWYQYSRAISDGLSSFVPYVAYLSFILSFAALFVTLYERRARLLVHMRKGRWTSWRGDLLIAVLEVYNKSSRPNTVSGYCLEAKSADGKWIPLESERYEPSIEGEDGVEVFNDTPVTLAPYSGMAVKVGAFGQWHTLPSDLSVRVSAVDLFGTPHRVVFTVVNRKGVSLAAR